MQHAQAFNHSDRHVASRACVLFGTRTNKTQAARKAQLLNGGARRREKYLRRHDARQATPPGDGDVSRGGASVCSETAGRRTNPSRREQRMRAMIGLQCVARIAMLTESSTS